MVFLSRALECTAPDPGAAPYAGLNWVVTRTEPSSKSLATGKPLRAIGANPPNDDRTPVPGLFRSAI